jgi:Protein of unknown function (DUF3421)
MGPPNRRRSIDSSSGSSSSSKQDDQPQSERKHVFNISKKEESNSGSGSRGAQASPQKAGTTSTAATTFQEPPPSYVPPPASTALKVDQVPPSGYRIPLSTPGIAFPGVDRTRAAPFMDKDGHSPVFIGSALMQYSVHPCKIAPHLPRPSPCRVPYGGQEYAHLGRYDLLPFVPEQMEFVPTSHGRIPPLRRPIKGGFENTGAELYHALAVIDGVKVPGKTGTHLVCSTPLLPAVPPPPGDLPICRTGYELMFLSGRLQRRVCGQGTYCE